MTHPSPAEKPWRASGEYVTHKDSPYTKSFRLASDHEAESLADTLNAYDVGDTESADELSRLAGELARVEGERDAARKAVRSEHSFVRQKESEIITLRDDRYVLAAECAAARVLHTTSIGVINDGWPQESLVDATATLKAARSATDASQAIDRAARSLPTPPAKEQP